MRQSNIEQACYCHYNFRASSRKKRKNNWNVLLVNGSRRQFQTNNKDQPLPTTIPPFKSAPYHTHKIQFPTSTRQMKAIY